MSNNVNTQGNVRVPGRLKQTAIDEHGNLLPIAGASDIYDDDNTEWQKDINTALLQFKDDQEVLNEELRNATSVAPSRLGPYDDEFNGMEKVYLTKNVEEDFETGIAHNYLTQAMFHRDGEPIENAIFVINYDYELCENITIPAESVLQFEGGSISGNGNNNTITGNNTQIKANAKCFNLNIVLNGVFLSDFTPEMFGKCGTSNDAAVIQHTLDVANAIGRNVKFDNVYNVGTTLNIDRPVSTNDAEDYLKLYGSGTINANNCILFSSSIQYVDMPVSQRIKFDGLTFKGDMNSKVFSHKFLRIYFDNCSFHIKAVDAEQYLQSIYFTNCLVGKSVGVKYEETESWLKIQRGCYDIQINDCSCDGDHTWGTLIDLRATDGKISTKVGISNTLIEGFNNYGIHYEKVDAFSVVSCYFEDNTLGNIHYSGSEMCNGIVILSCYFYTDKNNIKPGVVFGSATAVVVGGNKFSNCLPYYQAEYSTRIKILDEYPDSKSAVCNILNSTNKVYFGTSADWGHATHYAYDLIPGDIIINTDPSSNIIYWRITSAGTYSTAAKEAVYDVNKAITDAIKDNVDLNNFTSPGYYCPTVTNWDAVNMSYSGLSNFPTNRFGCLKVEGNYPYVVLQTYISPKINANDEGEIWVRTYYPNGGRWSDWVKTDTI